MQCKVASGHDVGVQKLILVLILTLRWFHLELQKVDGGILVDTVQASPGQPALAGGQEDGDKRLSSLPRELHLNFRNRTISSSLSTLLEDVNGFELHKHYGQGILL